MLSLAWNCKEFVDEQRASAGGDAASDGDLVRLIGRIDMPSMVRRTAKAEFYTRFAPSMFVYCLKCHGSEFGAQGDRDSEIKSFIGEVMMRFFDAAAKFDPDVAKTPGDVPKLIRCWLKRQAEWTIRDWFPPPVVASTPDPEDLFSQSPQERQRRTRKQIVQRWRLRKVLREMPERARDIIITSIKYRDSASGVFRLPDHIEAALCTKWNFNSSNALVQYRKRKWEELQSRMRQQVA
jgi:hypothetical protein